MIMQMALDPEYEFSRNVTYKLLGGSQCSDNDLLT